jgi:hypothetical protein
MRLTVYHYYGDSSSTSDFDVNLNNHCNDNFSDIRFLREGGVQWLDYWIEEYTSGQNATVWVEFDEISTGGTNFSIFYSNPGAGSESNGEKTWDFFDDFPGSSVNSTKWDTVNDPGGTVADSELTISKTVSSSGIVHGYQTKDSFDDCRMVARGQTGHSQTQSSAILISQYNSQGCLNKIEFRSSNDLWLRTDLRDCGGSYTNNATNDDFALDTYYTYYYVREGAEHIRAWEDGSFVGEVTSNIRDASDPGAILLSFWAGVQRTQDIMVDWYGVGKYCDPEPTWSDWRLGNEPLVPDVIDDLAAATTGWGSIELTWTTDADQFDIRYSTSQIDDEADWDAAQQCVGETASPYNVTGLAPSTAYYFRMKAAYSDIGEWNPVSNQASDTTLVSYCPYEQSYDFANLCDGKQGYESDVDQFPFDGETGYRHTYLEVGTSPTGSGGYEDIDANDANEWITENPGQYDYIVTWWHMYVNHSISDIDWIYFRLNGNTAGGTTNHSLWVLKNDSRDDWEQNSAWTYLNSTPNIYENNDTNVSWTIDSNISDYVDARDGKITFLVENADRAAKEMRTNYVVMTVNGSPVCGDITAPAAVYINATRNSSNEHRGISIDLDWIAPGDDSILGTATEYDIRYSTAGPINDGNWDSATQVALEKAPQSAGIHEYFTVSGLNPSTWYWFAIKTRDEVPHWSAISNSPYARTHWLWPNDPGPVKDLGASGTCNNIKLTWTAPGSTGYGGSTVSSYDIRYSTSGPIKTHADWVAATECTGEPTPASPGTKQSFNQSFLDSGAATTYWFSIKSTSSVTGTSEKSLTSPSAQPNHGDLKGTEWWLWQIYYNSEEGEENTVYHIANVRAVDQTATVDYSPLDNPDPCVFPGYELEGSAIIDWSCDQGGSETDPTRERRVDSGLGAGLNSELLMDSELYVEGNDATMWIDVNALPRSFQTYLGIGDGDIPTDYLYSYQHDSIPPEDSGPPGVEDGYPFVDGEDDWKQWVWGDASGDNIALDDQEQEKGYQWEVDSTIASYDVGANCEAPAATGTFNVAVVNRTNNYFKTYDPTYGGNRTPDADTTQYWYSCPVKNFVRLLDQTTYAGYEDWGIVEYETRNLSATIDTFSDAGSGFDITVTITNNEDTAGNFSVLVLIMNMDAVTDDPWSDGEPYPGGETVFPDVSAGWDGTNGISSAIQYTGNLGSGSSIQKSWTNVGVSSGTPEYKLWVTGATATIN